MDIDKLRELGLTDEEIMSVMQIGADLPDGEEDGLYQAASAIAGLQGEERAKALAELSTDYEGRSGSLKDDLTMAYDQSQTKMPEGQMSSSNQFGYYVAPSALEFAAAGVDRYRGNKAIQEARGEREKLSKMQESGHGRMLGSMADNMVDDPETAGMTPAEKMAYNIEKQRRQARLLYQGPA